MIDLLQVSFGALGIIKLSAGLLVLTTGDEREPKNGKIEFNRYVA
jgi:hypothetical protein